MEDVEDFIDFNGIPCYVLPSKENISYYLIVPALEGPGMLMDSFYMTIGNYREPTFVKLTCQLCSNITYFDTSRIPNGEKYSFKCDHCDYVFFRKKN